MHARTCARECVCAHVCVHVCVRACVRACMRACLHGICVCNLMISSVGVVLTMVLVVVLLVDMKNVSCDHQYYYY